MNSAADELAAARAVEHPDARLCARIARRAADRGDREEAARWAVRTVDGGADTTAWTAASRVLAGHPIPAPARAARVAVVGTATTDVLTAVLPVAFARERIAATVTQTGFGLYWQEILDTESTLRRSDPDVVVLVPHLDATALIGHSDEPDSLVDAEVRRWSSAWSALRADRNRHVIQVGFATPDADPLGHLAATQPGSRLAMARALDSRLALEAGRRDIGWVDRETLTARSGRDRWFDPRWWYVAKHDPSMSQVPTLAHHVAVVTAARLGLARKCLVTDLDGTLWGGSVGDDGIGGLVLGGTPEGEAHVDLQRVMLGLRDRGVVLAVCSKNSEGLARAPFEQLPGMALELDDFAIFVANWEPKPRNLREIARRLDLGLDALAFVDDNPAEREAVRAELPQVDVVALPDDVTGFPTALARHPRFETATFSVEDRSRTEHYRARATAEEARAAAGSLEDFLVDMEMSATLAPVREATESRVAQLLAKTNQWNLTTRRHTLEDVRRIASDDDWVTITAQLRDRLADHGLVAVLLARKEGAALEIDSFLMSCRVIGRRLEHAVMDALVEEAGHRGCQQIVGRYAPTDRNGVVAGVFDRLGFEMISEQADGSTTWTLDIGSARPMNDVIEILTEQPELT